MNLIDVTKQFGTDEQCLAYLEAMRWPDGVRCPVCGAKEVSRVERKKASKNKRHTLYQCLEPTCKTQFSATSGTIFHDSHVPLTKWFMALALILNAKKGMSAMQLQRDLGLGSYRTAWYLYHRIREAMQSGGGLLTGTVEMDEVYLGGKQRGHKSKLKNKDCVLGMKQRDGELRLVKIEDRSIDSIFDAMKANVSKDVERIMTDDMHSYSFKLTMYHRAKHDKIKHSRKIYAVGDITTNRVESSFSLLRRAIIGSFHQLSIKHLQRYLNEFTYRYNRREIATLFEDTMRRLTGFGNLPYKKLTADT